MSQKPQAGGCGQFSKHIPEKPTRDPHSGSVGAAVGSGKPQHRGSRRVRGQMVVLKPQWRPRFWRSSLPRMLMLRVKKTAARPQSGNVLRQTRCPPGTPGTPPGSSRLHQNCCFPWGSEGVPVSADDCFGYRKHHNKLSHKSVAENTATCNFSQFCGLTDVVPFLASAMNYPGLLDSRGKRLEGSRGNFAGGGWLDPFPILIACHPHETKPRSLTWHPAASPGA